MRKLLSGGIFLALLISVRGQCRADILFDLTPSVVTVNPGGVVHFFATVSNLDLVTSADLAQISSTIVPALDDSEDPTPFFNNFAPSLAAGATIDNQAIYDITVNPTATAGTYDGSLTISDSGGTALTGGVAHFTLTVTPEPAEFVLYGLGVIGIMVWKGRRRAGVGMVSRSK